MCHYGEILRTCLRINPNLEQTIVYLFCFDFGLLFYILLLGTIGRLQNS